MGKPRCTPWTAEDDAKLLALRGADNHSFEWIGRQLNRTSKSCSSRYSSLKRRKPETGGLAKDIPCLRCRRDFKSPDYRRIRICPSCHNSEAYNGAGVFAAGASVSGRGFVTRSRPAA